MHRSPKSESTHSNSPSTHHRLTSAHTTLSLSPCKQTRPSTSHTWNLPEDARQPIESREAHRIIGRQTSHRTITKQPSVDALGAFRQIVTVHRSSPVPASARDLSSSSNRHRIRQQSPSHESTVQIAKPAYDLRAWKKSTDCSQHFACSPRAIEFPLIRPSMWPPGRTASWSRPRSPFQSS